MKHAHKAAIAVGSQPPIVRISFLEPEDDWDSGYLILYSDAPDLDNEVDDATTLVCVHCLVDHDPEAGRGLDLARQHGGASLDDGEWAVADHL
jgi:hypothetical protein